MDVIDRVGGTSVFKKKTRKGADTYELCTPTQVAGMLSRLVKEKTSAKMTNEHKEQMLQLVPFTENDALVCFYFSLFCFTFIKIFAHVMICTYSRFDVHAVPKIGMVRFV